MKKILYTLALLISFSSFGQRFNDWEFTETNLWYLITNSSGIAVKNCESVPELYVRIKKDSGGTMGVSLLGELYQNYEGDEIKVEIMFKTKGGTFESGIEGVKTQDFGSDSYTKDSERWLELVSVKYGSVANLITGDFANFNGNSGYEQVYFKTTYNGESKVFRFSLNGYYDAFQIFRKKWDENENPFDN